jgi:hypothetical protein
VKIPSVVLELFRTKSLLVSLQLVRCEERLRDKRFSCAAAETVAEWEDERQHLQIKEEIYREVVSKLESFESLE